LSVNCDYVYNVWGSSSKEQICLTDLTEYILSLLSCFSPTRRRKVSPQNALDIISTTDKEQCTRYVLTSLNILCLILLIVKTQLKLPFSHKSYQTFTDGIHLLHEHKTPDTWNVDIWTQQLYQQQNNFLLYFKCIELQN